MHPLLDQLERNVSERGDHLAACDDQMCLDYKTFRAVAGGLGRRLGEQTDNPRVGILAPTSSACAAAIFGCWYAGRTPVPLNFLLAPAEFARVVRDAELDCLVAVERFAPLAQAADVRLLPLSPEILVPADAPAPQAASEDLGVLLYTSGTSAEPKGVCLSFGNLAANARACIEAAELSADQVFLSLLPQFHAFGLTANTIVPLVMGATVYYQARFSPMQVMQTIHEKRVSVFITVASMFAALAGMKSATREHFASLTHPVSGGEPLSPKVFQLFEERFGKRVLEGYGMTEASPVVSLNTPRAFRRGSVGRPLPGISVIVVDEAGNELPVGSEGELTIHGHCVMQGYLNKPELTGQAVRAGALHTGDVGHVDGDGFIFITGRAKDMIIVGGENVFPFEIESVLVEHPSVAEAAVVGARDDVRGEVPLAYVILAEGASEVDETELREFCRGRLAAYKVPRQVRFAEELPHGPTGKILKRALRAELD